jgi:hypothetical protein
LYPYVHALRDALDKISREMTMNNHLNNSNSTMAKVMAAVVASYL